MSRRPSPSDGFTQLLAEDLTVIATWLLSGSSKGQFEMARQKSFYLKDSIATPLISLCTLCILVNTGSGLPDSGAGLCVAFSTLSAIAER
jgi:hypothetical protein